MQRIVRWKRNAADCEMEAECSGLWFMEYAFGCTRRRDTITRADRVVVIKMWSEGEGGE